MRSVNHPIRVKEVSDAVTQEQRGLGSLSAVFSDGPLSLRPSSDRWFTMALDDYWLALAFVIQEYMTVG